MALWASRLETDLAAFRERVEPFLVQNESANNLPLGLLGRMTIECSSLVMAVVERESDLMLAALQTDAKQPLVLSFNENPRSRSPAKPVNCAKGG